MSIKQSRYAVLRDDDDGERGKQCNPTAIQKRVKSVEAKTNKVKNENKTTNKQKSKKKSKPKEDKADGNQWEQWKKTDEKVMEQQFVDDLKLALMESKTLFEEKKKCNNEENGFTANQSGKKKTNEKSNKVTVCLDEFLESDKHFFENELLKKKDKKCIQSTDFNQISSFDDICNESFNELQNNATLSKFSVLDDNSGFIQKTSKKKSKKDQTYMNSNAQTTSTDAFTKKLDGQRKKTKSKEKSNDEKLKNKKEETSGSTIKPEENYSDFHNAKVTNKIKNQIADKSLGAEALNDRESNSTLHWSPHESVLPMNFHDELLLREVRNEVERIMRQESELESSKHNNDFRNNGFGVELRAKNDLIEKYGKEIITLREELRETKLKNKKLIEILKVGEMKEKSEILVENERLTQVNEELKEEVSRLFTTLEQEKSKVHELQDKIKRLTFNSQRKRSEDSFSKQ